MDDPTWKDEKRYVLDKLFFWTMPSSDYPAAEGFWLNIKENVMADTLCDSTAGDKANSFWRASDNRYFHVRPKAKNSTDLTKSPISNNSVPKKAYWFNNDYLLKEIIRAYGDDWEKLKI